MSDTTPSAVPPAGATSGPDNTAPPAKMPGAVVVDDGGRPVTDDGGRPVPVEYPSADAIDAGTADPAAAAAAAEAQRATDPGSQA